MRRLVCDPADRLEVDAFLDHLVQRAHVAELLDGLDDATDGEVNLLLGGEATDAEADGGVSELDIDAHGAKHVAGLQAGRGAG